jgi:hypothetical protein
MGEALTVVVTMPPGSACSVYMPPSGLASTTMTAKISS